MTMIPTEPRCRPRRPPVGAALRAAAASALVDIASSLDDLKLPTGITPAAFAKAWNQGVEVLWEEYKIEPRPDGKLPDEAGIDPSTAPRPVHVQEKDYIRNAADAFFRVFTPDFLFRIVRQTNLYGKDKCARRWNELTIGEAIETIAFNLYMACVRRAPGERRVQRRLHWPPL